MSAGEHPLCTESLTHSLISYAATNHPPLRGFPAGLTHLEYAPVAELLGLFPVASVATNCSAPHPRRGPEGRGHSWEKFLTRKNRHILTPVCRPGTPLGRGEGEVLVP